MKIPSHFGLQKTSLVDYPGKIAPVIFFPGCNLRCPYCHNPDLAYGRTEGLIPYNEVLHFLKFRAPLLGGVVLSGGEPLLYKGLRDFISEIKGLTGLDIKVDTNGLSPSALDRLEADYIAMDLKMLPEKYPLLGGGDSSADSIKESIRILSCKNTTYELRTTLVPHLLPMEDIPFLADLIGTAPHFITSFRPGGCLNPDYDELPRVDISLLEEYRQEFRKHGCQTEIRK